MRIGKPICVAASAVFGAVLIASSGPSAAAGSAPSKVAYFSVQPDPRLCPAPFCGGVFVSLLNHRLTPCPGGEQREACHASVVDWSRLGLSPAATAELEAAVLAGRGLVRGELKESQVADEIGPVVVLTVTEGWIAASARRPKGGYFQVADNGIVCITTPCFSVRELLLNASQRRKLSSLDLSAVGASEKALQTAFDQLHTGSILVAGRNRTVPNAGPAGTGVELAAAQFYLRVSRSVPPR